MTASFYTQDVKDFTAFFERAEAQFKLSPADALKKMQSAYHDGKLPLLRVPEKNDDLVRAEEAVRRLIDGKKYIILLGTGGSGLGAAAVAQTEGYGYAIPQDPAKPGFYVWDNLDAVTLQAGLRRLPLEQTAFLIISKSGGTLETLTQAYVAASYYDEKGLADVFNRSVLVVTEPKESALTRFAQARNLPTLPHETEIGGRYSVLSMTGIVPAYAVGANAKAMREGAKSVIDALMSATEPEECAPLQGARALVAAEKALNISAHVMKAYGDCFIRFGDWVRQLWAESLGKDEKGVLFAPAVGPLDQHSQLQLYLGGPNNKTYTVLSRKGDGGGIGDIIKNADKESFGYLEDKHVGRVTEAERIATVDSLRSAGRPVRVIETEGADIRTLGALFTHFMLETVFAADFIGVDAFDQPAVEDGKVRARRILSAA